MASSQGSLSSKQGRSFTPETQEAALAALRKRKATKDALTVVMEDGTRIYPDTLPGVGWVIEGCPTGELDAKGRKVTHSRKYWKTKDQCLARYAELKAGMLRTQLAP